MGGVDPSGHCKKGWWDGSWGDFGAGAINGIYNDALSIGEMAAEAQNPYAYRLFRALGGKNPYRSIQPGSMIFRNPDTDSMMYVSGNAAQQIAVLGLTMGIGSGGEGAAAVARTAKGLEAAGGIEASAAINETSGLQLLGRNLRINKGRALTDLPGGRATAKSIFRNLTKGKKVTEGRGKGGDLQRYTDGRIIQIRMNPDGTTRIDLIGRGPTGLETIHFGSQ